VRWAPITKSVRLLDLTVAGLIFLLVLPLMLLCALGIFLSSRGPVIYRQARVGREGRQFTCLKFRTMIHSTQPTIDALLAEGSAYREEWASLYKLRADPRVTPFGHFMRRYSLDELPQLFNVFRGDMSVVGPRPIVEEEIHRYGDRFADYCSVNPGITGLWQVSGRHALSYDERVRLDSEYANNKSLSLDLLILWRTFPVVFWGQNE
jgi:lipopolysaccharide/colanic/teichoic acid biosynthesis glycosyltransferase